MVLRSHPAIVLTNEPNAHPLAPPDHGRFIRQVDSVLGLVRLHVCSGSLGLPSSANPGLGRRTGLSRGLEINLGRGLRIGLDRVDVLENSLP